MRRAIGFLVVVGLLSGAVWVGLGVKRREPGPPPRLLDAAEQGLRGRTPGQPAVPRCSEDIPFEPTYLPDGFVHEEIAGRFPGGRPPDDPSSTGGKRNEVQVIVHYRGPGSRAIEVRRPGTSFAELAQGNDAPTIKVLGTDTSGFAPIAPGGNEFIVQFPFPGMPSHTNGVRSTRSTSTACRWPS